MEKAVYLSDGYLGMSGAAELYVNSLARDIAPVRLTGNWGSELLRRVRAFKFTEPRSGFLHPDLQPYIHEARESFMKLSLMNRLSFVALNFSRGFSAVHLNALSTPSTSGFMSVPLGALNEKL